MNQGIRRATFTRMYLRGAREAHLAIDSSGPPMACGKFDAQDEVSPSRWLGTGCQDEIDRAARMPVCGKCLAAVESWYGSPETTGPALPAAERKSLT